MADLILVYVGSPYSHSDPRVVQERFEVIYAVTECIIREQRVVVPFSPIAYTHQFCHIPGVDWVKWDINFLKVCKAMLIVQMQGWVASVGVQKEKNYCQTHGIPVFYTTVDGVLECCREIANYFGGD